MKKINTLSICFALVLLFVTNNAIAGSTFKFGVDFNGDHEWETGGETISMDPQTGFSLATEFFGSVHKNVDLGGGLLVQFPRDVEFQGVTGTFMFMPIYGLLRVKVDSEETAPYGTFQFGYNFFSADDAYKYPGSVEGGIYYGFGGGIIFQKRYFIEALYSVNNGKWEYSGLSVDIKNTQFSLNFGFNF